MGIPNGSVPTVNTENRENMMKDENDISNETEDKDEK